MEDTKYKDLFQLLEKDSAACEYYYSLPDYVRESMQERAGGVNSFESLRHYADNLTQGDR